jgi:hypothetical protein
VLFGWPTGIAANKNPGTVARGFEAEKQILEVIVDTGARDVAPESFRDMRVS